MPDTSPTGPRRLLANEALKSHLWFGALTTALDTHLLEIRFSPKLIADLLLPECQPSCAWIVIDAVQMHPEGLEHYLSRLDRAQSVYKNVLCLLIGCNDDARHLWQSLNETCPPGRARLITCPAYGDIFPSLQSVYNVLAQSDKLQSQREYFQRERRKVESADSAMAILREGLGRLGFSEGDVMVAVQSAPSIGKLVGLFSSSIDFLTDTLPVDECYLYAAKMFFQD